MGNWYRFLLCILTPAARMIVDCGWKELFESYVHTKIFLSLPSSLSFRLRYVYTCVDVHLYTHPKFDFKQCAAVLSRSCSRSLFTLVLRICAVRHSPATNQGVSGRMSTYQSQVSRSGYCPWQVTTSPVVFKKGTCLAES